MSRRRGGGCGRQPVELSVLWEKPRHPAFDAMWAEYQNLVWWWAHRLAWFVNRANQIGKARRGRWTGEDFVGLLTIKFNFALHGWDPDGGAGFSTWFSYQIVEQCMRYVVRLDRDRGVRTEEQQRTALEAYAYERGQRYNLYRTPEDFGWEEQMLDLLGDDPWGRLTRGLPDRARTILEWRFRDGKTLEQCGALVGVTKERVRQIEADTLKAVRARIERYEPARRLFFGDAA